MRILPKCFVKRGFALLEEQVSPYTFFHASKFSSHPNCKALPHLVVGSEQYIDWASKESRGAAVLLGGLEEQNLCKLSLQRLANDLQDTEILVEASTGGADYRDGFLDVVDFNKSFQADVPVPLSLLLDHIKAKDAKDESAHHMTLYLAQRDIHEQFPGLALDPGLLPLKGIARRMYQQSIWLGPKGTRTPLHSDPYYNLFCQVWGRKRVRIFDDSDRDKLYPYSSRVLKNTSQIEQTDSVDPLKYPNFSTVEYQECILGPGQILYIPKKCWHECISLCGSLSISFWWT